MVSVGCRGAHQASMDQNPLVQFSTQLYKWREKRLNQMLASIEFSRTRTSWLLQPVKNGDKCSLMHTENSSVFTVTGICFLAALSALTSALTHWCLFELSWAKHQLPSGCPLVKIHKVCLPLASLGTTHCVQNIVYCFLNSPAPWEVCISLPVWQTGNKGSLGLTVFSVSSAHNRARPNIHPALFWTTSHGRKFQTSGYTLVSRRH